MVAPRATGHHSERGEGSESRHRSFVSDKMASTSIRNLDVRTCVGRLRSPIHPTHRPARLPDQVGGWTCSLRVGGGRLRPAPRPALDGGGRRRADALSADPSAPGAGPAVARCRHAASGRPGHAGARAAPPALRCGRSRRRDLGRPAAPRSGRGSGPRAGSPTSSRLTAAWSTCPTTSVRPANPAYVPAGSRVSFADAFPFLLLSEESLADLNRRMPSPVPMNRFRPNLVISGGDAYQEDGMTVFQVGALRISGREALQPVRAHHNRPDYRRAGPRAAPDPRHLPAAGRTSILRAKCGARGHWPLARGRGPAGVNSRPMEVQIFGIRKSAETRKALRFFAERRIKTHFVDLEEQRRLSGRAAALCAEVRGRRRWSTAARGGSPTSGSARRAKRRAMARHALCRSRCCCECRWCASSSSSPSVTPRRPGASGPAGDPARAGRRRGRVRRHAAARRRDVHRRPGRAVGHHRPERLGQDHAASASSPARPSRARAPSPARAGSASR